MTTCVDKKRSITQPETFNQISTNMATKAPPSIVEASIQDLSSALQSGRTTAVELIAKCLLRISTYDCRNTALNSVPLLNPNVFEEAAASDDRRRHGKALGRLDGIPFTVKDSYKVKGMTVASGSEAFKNLVANEDAFTVEALRKAGAILIGKTNMCPMAFGGMQRGVYGRAESPYNSKYLAAAFASGSSNGSGVSTAASFAAFGMGEETVSSGRSPASNNALVAYTPSRGLISIRGNWPLYPTCDTVVPHTRSMDDLFEILDVLATEDDRTAGDFWRDQPFVAIPKSWQDRPRSFQSLKTPDFLKGKRIGVPEMYLGRSKNAVYTSDAVCSLWEQTRQDLESSGATVKTCRDFPAVTAYEDPSRWHGDASLPNNWNFTERGTLIAHSWDDFLRLNRDPKIPSLAAAEGSKLFPQLPEDHPQVKFSEIKNAVHWSKLAGYVEHNESLDQEGKRQMYDILNLERAVKTLELMRKILLEDWMAENKLDFVVFPAAGDVGYADADVESDLAEHTWKWGVRYSNGNRALRHLGIPSVTVPMGMIPGKDMPMGLTIVGKGYEDIEILKAGYAYEQIRQSRVAPPLTPLLDSDRLEGNFEALNVMAELEVTSCNVFASGEKDCRVLIEGVFTTCSAGKEDERPCLEIFVDARRVEQDDIQIHIVSSSGDERVCSFTCSTSAAAPRAPDGRNAVVGKIARDSIMLLMLARDKSQSRPTGCMRLIHMDDIVRT